MEVSAKEEAILRKLKSVEKTTEDIIKVSVKLLQKCNSLFVHHNNQGKGN